MRSRARSNSALLRVLMPEQLTVCARARGGERAVVAPEMHAVGAALQRERQIVVDDKGHAAAPAEREESTGFLNVLPAFAPVLQGRNASFERLGNAAQQCVAISRLGRDGVKPAQLHLAPKKRFGRCWPRPGRKPAFSACQV